ncbi:hypothetical protein Tco_0651808 [Tanacetum coccineum]|uniref:Uncharacterized protein n=1 Tax=Tanacetum coccineum TaxID=301880 RepID=A0ABQ4WVT3_9ASTR
MYGDTISFKRCRDDKDKDKEPSAGSNRGSKRRRARKEPVSTSIQKEKTSMTIGKSTEGSKYHHKSAQAEEPMHTAEDLEEPAHQEFKEDTRKSFDELMDTSLDFSAFVMNRLKIDTLTPELLAGPTFELMKGSCKSLVKVIKEKSQNRRDLPRDILLVSVEVLRFDTSAGNPVKEIFLKLNLPDHRILKDGHEGTDTSYLLDEYDIWLFHQELRDISTLGSRVESTLMQILQILRRDWGRYTDADGAHGCSRTKYVTSRAWRRLFKVRGPLVHELILEFFSTFRFGEVVLDLDTTGALQFQLGREMESAGFDAYWAESARQIPDKGDLSAYWRGISSEGDFLGTAPSYTTIRDLMLRLLTEERLKGLTVMDQDLPVIDMAKMVVEGAPNINEGAQAVPAPIQAPQPHLQLDLLGLYHRGWLDWRRRYMGCERHWSSRERYWIVWPVISPDSLHGRYDDFGLFVYDRSLADLAGKKSTTLVKYRSSGILCGFAAVLAVLVTGASQSRQRGGVTKAPTKGSKTGKSASAKEPVEEPIAEVIMDDAGDDLVRDDDQPQAASKPLLQRL